MAKTEDTKKNLHLKRCPKCENWSDVKTELCPKCGFELLKQKRAEIDKRMKTDDIRIPIWRTTKDDSFWLLLIKRPVQFVQLILYSIVGFLVYLSTSFAH